MNRVFNFVLFFLMFSMYFDLDTGKILLTNMLQKILFHISKKFICNKKSEEKLLKKNKPFHKIRFKIVLILMHFF